MESRGPEGQHKADFYVKLLHVVSSLVGWLLMTSEVTGVVTYNGLCIQAIIT